MMKECGSSVKGLYRRGEVILNAHAIFCESGTEDAWMRCGLCNIRKGCSSQFSA